MNNQLISGIKNFSKRTEKIISIYNKISEEASHNDTKIFHISEQALFQEAIKNLATVLNPEDAKYPLESIYDIAFHKDSGTLIISNKGATLYCLSPRSRTPYITRHIGLCLYVPGLGIEFVNVGLVGNVYQGNIVLRSESACTPSFMFGSQRCNCAHQWDSIREAAAHFNKIKTPNISNGHDFEKWVQQQIIYREGKHVPRNNGPGFVLMHLDTQNGMGSGYTKNEFSFDLYSRASIRHRGEYSSEQTHNVTMYQGFEAIGLKPDPRTENDNIGYKISRIVLDYLDVSHNIVMLTNNVLKIKYLEDNGYRVRRVKTLGEINTAGSQEAHQRLTEFNHVDIDGDIMGFDTELDRLKVALSKIIQDPLKAEQGD